jgi:hypothetical protein
MDCFRIKVCHECTNFCVFVAKTIQFKSFFTVITKHRQQLNVTDVIKTLFKVDWFVILNKTTCHVQNERCRF